MSTTSREAVIAAEQKAVDRAYDCYEARLAEMTSQSSVGASASGKDSIAVRKDAEATAAEYGGLGGEALVISRVDIQESGGTEPETFYVGRRSVSDSRTRDQVVVAWTAPLAVRWSNARPETPGEVLLRRQLRCAERTVEDYFDEIAPTAAVARTGTEAPAHEAAVPAGREAAPTPSGLPDDTAELPAEAEDSAPRSVPSPRDIVRRQRKKPQVDEFLLRELHRSRSGRMRDIVETIRRDQMALVTGSPADILVIQGGPGTGKSAVGLHRVTWLVNNDHFRAQDILVVGPHQNFLAYVGRVLPTLGTRNVNAVQLSRLWEGEVRGADSAAARLVKSGERMGDILRRRVESECRPEALDSLVTAPSHDKDEAAFTVAVGSTSFRLPRSEVLGLLREAREAAGAYRARRDRFRTLLVDRLLGELVRIAPRRSRDETVRRDLERNRQVAALVDRTWPALSPEEALRSLLNSPVKLAECASRILDDAEQAALQRAKAESAAEEPWTLDDLVCLEELRFLIAGETPQRYRHIVVDEAQDLTPMQARSLRRRCPTGSMTVLGDLAQATGPHAYTNWDRLGGLLSDQGDWRVTELNTSYRVPAQIMEFVAPLGRAVAPSLPYPAAVRPADGEAVRLVPTAPWELLDEAATRTANLVGTDDGRSLRSVAVIVPDDSDWLGEVRQRVDRADGMTDEKRRTVSVLAAAQAKGMEFDHVLVLEPTTIADRGPAGLRQLYVALTRSTQTLTVLHTTPLPKELLGEGVDGDDPAHGSQADETPDASARMAPRYMAALGVLRDIAHGDGAVPPEAAARLSELKGMANRSLCRDQADALSVWRLLGSPDRHRLSDLVDLAQRTRNAVTSHEPGLRTGLANDPAFIHWADILAKAGDNLRHRYGTGPEQDHSAESETVTAPEDSSGSVPETEPQDKKHEHKDTAPLDSSASPVEGTAPSEALERELEAAAQADRECNTHEAVRFELLASLLRAGLRPSDSPVADVILDGQDGLFLYEVLGAGRSSYADLRAGATRLLEINHILPRPADRGYLVLSEPPAEDWAPATVRDVFGVHILWKTADGWGGQDKEAALSDGG